MKRVRKEKGKDTKKTE